MNKPDPIRTAAEARTKLATNVNDAVHGLIRACTELAERRPSSTPNGPPSAPLRAPTLTPPAPRAQ